MMDRMQSAWRARRVLLIGHEDGLFRSLALFLGELGARITRMPPGTDAETYFRAMISGRVSAVIVVQAHQLAPGRGPTMQLRVLDLILSEARETGIPLVMLACLHDAAPDAAQERAQSILRLYADGVCRGLFGDPVSVQYFRPTPGTDASAVCAGMLDFGARFLSGDTELTGVMELDVRKQA